MNQSNIQHLTDITRYALNLEKGCQLYDLTTEQYNQLVSDVSDSFLVDSSTASQVLAPLINEGSLNLNDDWSSSVSFVSNRYNVDASKAAQLLSNGVPTLPMDGSMTREQWNDAISEVSKNLSVDAAKAANILSINLIEHQNDDSVNMTLQQWRDAISSVSEEYGVDAAQAAQMLNQQVKLSQQGEYKVTCRRV